MAPDNHAKEKKEISCRVTRTLLMYVREKNSGSLGPLLDGLALDEAYLADTNNWVSHALLQQLYHRMIKIIGDDNAVYHMTLAAERYHSLGILDRIVRLLGSPRHIYSLAPKYNRYLKLNGSVYIHDLGPSWVVLEDRYHDSSQKTRFDCDYTRGVLAGIPTLFGLPLAEVEEIQCQVAPEIYGRRIWPDQPSQGSKSCLYRVRWAPRRRSIFKRGLLRKNEHHQAIEELSQANQLIQAKYSEVKELMHNLEKANRELIRSQQSLEAQKEALMESERKYRLIAEHVSDIIWIFDLASMRFQYCSSSVEKIRGYTIEEALAMDIEQTLSAKSVAKVMDILDTELANDGNPGVDPQRSRTIEIQQSVKNGGYRWAEATMSFIRDKAGQPTAIMGVTRDIDERKEAQERIAESERKYHNLFENGSDLICIHDLEGNLLETNLPYKKKYGWRQEDLEGINIRMMIPEHYRPGFDDYLARILKKGKDEGYLRGYTKSGDTVVLEYRNKLMIDEAGRPVSVYGAARDVTRRIQSEKALKESEEKYKNLVQHAPAGIFEFDMETLRFISVNDVMCEYTGYSEDEFLEIDPVTLLADESSKATFEKVIEEVFATKPHDLPSEFRIKGKDGHILWVLSNARFFYEDGAPKRAMAVITDVTEIRKAEEEKRILEAKLQNAKKLESLGTLAGGVAHDLNNILSGIVGYPDLLLHNLDPDSSLREPLNTIKKSGQKAAEVVQDLLTLARRSVSTKRVIDLNQIVQDYLTSLEYRKIIGEREDITVKVNQSDNVLRLMGSETHISKTIMNLVQNAVDAMPAGGNLTIATRDSYIDLPFGGFETIPMGEYAIVEIGDTGIGMPTTDLEKIFEPFYTKKVLGRSGTGLGMSVVWGTVKDHEGYIDIATAEGLGTTFSLYFPASRLDIDVQPSVYIEDYLGSGESILVIDDAQEQRELAMRMMRRLGYQVCSASSGEKAVKLIQQHNFDLLILDMIMPPGIDGLETYKRILDIVPGQKAIIASGYSQTENVKETLRLGAYSYVRKPFTLENIGLAVRRALRSER
jgi:PAS domain S-box-containing protein